MKIDKKLEGILFVFFASIIWATQPILAKLSYETSSYVQTTSISFIFITLIAFIYAIITKKEFKISRTELKAILYLTTIGTIFADFVYFYALTITPSLNAVLIGHIQPIFIILITFAILKEEKLSKWDYFGGIFMILSAVLVSARNLENLINLRLGTLGDLIVLSVTIAWASTAVVAKKYLKSLNSGVLVSYRYFFASVVFIIYLLIFSSLRINSIYQIVLGVLLGIGYILYYEGLKRIKTAQVGFIELCAPFSAAFLGWIILGETFTLMQLFGLGMLIIGVYFLSKRE